MLATIARRAPGTITFKNKTDTWIQYQCRTTSMGYGSVKEGIAKPQADVVLTFDEKDKRKRYLRLNPWRTCDSILSLSRRF